MRPNVLKVLYAGEFEFHPVSNREPLKGLLSRSHIYVSES